MTAVFRPIYEDDKSERPVDPEQVNQSLSGPKKQQMKSPDLEDILNQVERFQESSQPRPEWSLLTGSQRTRNLNLKQYFPRRLAVSSQAATIEVEEKKRGQLVA